MARHRVDQPTISGRSRANLGHYKSLFACVDRTFGNQIHRAGASDLWLSITGFRLSRALIGQADVSLAIEMNDLWGTVNSFSDRIVRRSRPATKPRAKIVTLGVRDLYLKSNYQDFARWQDVDLAIGDGRAVEKRCDHRLGRITNRW